ncbi:MAG: hypothetical protein R3D61_06815 [Defluviimonas denitrificans]
MRLETPCKVSVSPPPKSNTTAADDRGVGRHDLGPGHRRPPHSALSTSIRSVVKAVPMVKSRSVGTVVEHERIDMGAAAQRVVAKPAIQRVGMRAAVQVVVAIAPVKLVRPLAAKQPVGTQIAEIVSSYLPPARSSIEI